MWKAQVRVMRMAQEQGPDSESLLADGWVMGMALMWKYVMVRKYRAKLKRKLDATWAMGKALVWALELVRDKAPK